ncbi:hypothetical protein E4634_01435 [Mangrovimicrobium sediminis]|uniref:Uncharacterized protein n=1 Tax=Mangrovimicrobium sediminis TaxID=2562682 RepID=A0A4Z0M9T6_9GAMM|nr:hypothetical protein E4634_01435 [Haliea sp. SAOS-164]
MGSSKGAELALSLASRQPGIAIALMDNGAVEYAKIGVEDIDGPIL